MYSIHCLRRLSRHWRSQHSMSGTGNTTRFVCILQSSSMCWSFKVEGSFLVHIELNVVPLWLQMLSCLEYMYHDLGLVKEFNMNPITLKRWLVKFKQQFKIRSSRPNVTRCYYLFSSWQFKRTTETIRSTTFATASASVRWCTAWSTSATCRWAACWRVVGVHAW